MLPTYKRVPPVFVLTVLLATGGPALAGSYKALYLGSPTPDFVSALIEDAGLSVTFGGETVPADLSPWDVVVVRNYNICNHQTANQFRDYLAAGGGLALSGGTPFYLAGANSLSHIQEWFGATWYHNVGAADGKVAIDHPLGTDLMAGDITDDVLGGGVASVTNLLPTAVELVAWDRGGRIGTRDMQHEWSSGRVYYQSSVRPSYPATQDLFKAGVRWAAGAPNVIPEPLTVLGISLGIATLTVYARKRRSSCSRREA